MKNNAKKFPLPTGDKWSRLPERVAALEAAPKEPIKKVFEAVIANNGVDITITTLLKNTTGANFTFYRDNTGEYNIQSDIPIFPSREKVIVTFSVGKMPFIPSYNYSDYNKIFFSTTAVNGTLEDNLLVDNKITIEILD